MGSPSLVEPSDGSVTSDPRPSSTMCVLYQAEEIEVLMVRRSSSARFMAHAWVFPGGIVDPEDSSTDSLACIDGLSRSELGPWLAAAFREVAEETGIWLTDEPFAGLPGDTGVFVTARTEGLRFPASRTAYFANWITPTMIPVRFDARFFIAEMKTKLAPIPDQHEIDEAEFVTPDEALRRAEAGEWVVPFPTQRTLRELAAFPSVGAALDEWQHKEVVPIQPRMRIADDGSLDVVMPDDPGFDDLVDAGPDPDALAKAAKAAADRGRPIAEVVGEPD